MARTQELVEDGGGDISIIVSLRQTVKLPIIKVSANITFPFSSHFSATKSISLNFTFSESRQLGFQLNWRLVVHMDFLSQTQRERIPYCIFLLTSQIKCVQECVTIILTSSLYNLKAIYLHDVIQKDTTVAPETRNISKWKLRFTPLHGSLLYA